jgi:hypothetical protein
MEPTATLRLADPIRLLASTPDGARVVAVHERGFSLVDLASRAVTARGPVSGVVYACGVTPGGAALLLGTRAPTLVDLATRKVAPPAFKGPASASNALAFSPDGATVYLAHGSFAAPDDCYVYAFDLATRALRWRSSPTPGDGAMDVAVVGGRVVVFGEQGVISVLDASRGASVARVQHTPPAPYGEAMVLGASLGGERVAAVTLEAQRPVAARVDFGAGAPVVAWRTPLPLPEANPEEGFVVGRPLASGDAAHVPVRWSEGEGDGARARVTLFTLDAASGAVRGRRVLDGCENQRAIVSVGDGGLCWSSGADGVTVETRPGNNT